MTKRSKQLARTVLVMLGCSLFLVGCEDPDGVAWLPDSSGFVFSSGGDGAGGGDLRYFDVATKTRRILVGKTGALILRPAVSPDGKLLVIGLLKGHVHKPAELQLVFYDRQGNVSKKSSSFLWRPSMAQEHRKKLSPEEVKQIIAMRNAPIPTWLQWEAGSQKIIVADSLGGQIPDKLVAVYDPHTDQLLRLGMGDPRRGTIRPDGKGMLLTHLFNPVCFVKWDGALQIFAINPADVEAFKKVNDEPSEDLMAQKELRWERSTFVFSFSKGSFRFNTDTGVATFDSAPRIDQNVDGIRVFFEHSFPDTKQRLRLLQYYEDDFDEHDGTKRRQHFVRVEMFDSGTSKRQTIVPKTTRLTTDIAPNGKLIALRGDGRIRIVNSQGEIIANLDARSEK